MLFDHQPYKDFPKEIRKRVCMKQTPGQIPRDMKENKRLDKGMCI